jgi:mRNA interferase MazF
MENKPETYFKDFDGWNIIKKNIDRKELDIDFYYYQREVWWCSLGLNIGTEINGKSDKFERPILIIKKFNKNQFLGLPLTTKNKIGIYYKILNYITVDNVNRVGFLNLSQLKVISSKRLIRKLGTSNIDSFMIIKKAVINIIK